MFNHICYNDMIFNFQFINFACFTNHFIAKKYDTNQKIADTIPLKTFAFHGHQKLSTKPGK